MAEPLRVAVRRGEIVECIHEVHAVAVRDGSIVAEAGDPTLVASLRSSAKPLQALPLARAYENLTEDEVAIAAASHFGTPEHVAVVRRLLAATGGSEDELDCGIQQGRPPEPVFHNCSGKHAGMIAVCRANGWPVEGYRLPQHPLQLALLEEIAGAAELEPGEVATGLDGCGVVCFGIALERAAAAFSRLERLDGGDRIASSMRAWPMLIGGEGATDTELMRTQPEWLAKAGAEGLMCAVSSGGLGLALKVADGNSRALRPALAAFGAPLGLDLPTFAEVTLRNSHGEPAGIVSLS
ncbi:MAG: asparaginase [Actinomycetota bacterium]|nr:asparaginase [Actinomycetota bacterium]